jgi:hypothetical protein
VEPFLYAIYWLAGYRILAIILFGYVGFFGVLLGYVISGIFLRGFMPPDAIWLGLLSSSATLIGYKIWQKLSGKNDTFESVSFIALFYLVFLTSLITSIFRSAYLAFINTELSMEMLFSTLAANISGAFIFLFLVKILAKQIRHLIKTKN